MCEEYYPIKNSDGFLSVRWSDIPIKGEITPEAKRNLRKVIIECIDPMVLAFNEPFTIIRAYDQFASDEDMAYKLGLAIDIDCYDSSMLYEMKALLKAYRNVSVSIIEGDNKNKLIHLEYKYNF